MPDGNGKFLHDELIRQGRQTLAGRIFFVSGGANGKLQEFYDEMQTKGRLLQKPFRPEELITAVRKILLQIELQ